MTNRLMYRALPREIAEQIETIAGYARDEGLDFYETVFELLDFDQMNQVAAYGGFPQRYPHWRFGMEYERLRKTHSYGLGKIYEMVINNDPCYAYLLNDNDLVDHKTVIAHVYGHCDFFKNNIWFQHTNRRMMDEMANHATRIRRYIDRYGFDEVEEFLDVCLTMEDLIDPHSVFMRRMSHEHPTNMPRPRHIEEEVVRYPAKRYMDRFINPPERLARERERLRRDHEKDRKAEPPKPVRDVLLYLLENAPLEDWQSDILSIIREEAYYYAPQGQTKIMNEGWATYWHSTIMTRYCLRDDEVVTYCDHHSGTVATSPGRLNPYKLGLELFRDIEERWDLGRYGKEYESLEDIEARRNWNKDRKRPQRVKGKESPGREKIFDIRRIYNDVTFVDEFLTPELVDRLNLYHYRYDPNTRRMVVVNRDFDKIKQQLLFSLSNYGRPYIYVLDGNYANRGELYLGHKHNGVDLQIRYAIETLKNVYRIWQRPVHLQARIDDEMVLFSFNGRESHQQTITSDLPEPAHSV
ncbi:MAG TPA: SpoVR family protein [Phycisphaerae bacterium]|nr:SpoVR family protein [Phycisphaerae bacterium]